MNIHIYIGSTRRRDEFLAEIRSLEHRENEVVQNVGLNVA